jgi:carboxyl-terminal processing protease
MNSAWIRRLRPVGLLAALALAGCGGDGPTQPPTSMSPEAGAYLERVLDIMQTNSINRLKIDWPSFRSRVIEAAGPAQSTGATYPAIRVAIEMLGDGHTFLVTPHGHTIWVSTRSCSALPVSTPTLPEDVGYIRVRAFSGSAAQATAFADSIQGAIRASDRDDLAGWIVDLRGNGGGNMWPMVAGLGPIVGEGVLGHFIDPEGATSVWEYLDGASRIDGAAIQRVTTPYRLRRERPRVAVLIDNHVGSSGEATAITFKQRPDTRFFGTPTCGLSTANRGYMLSDGATLFLTVSVMADRERTPYGDQVMPDETITDPAQLVQRALAWLRSGDAP